MSTTWTIAITNLFGEFSDLQAGQLLDESLDPLALVETITARYRDPVGRTATGVEEFPGTPAGPHRGAGCGG